MTGNFQTMNAAATGRLENGWKNWLRCSMLSPVPLAACSGAAQRGPTGYIGKSPLKSGRKRFYNWRAYVTNAEAGHGLLRVGGAIVPFANEFPRTGALYQLWNTTPTDK